MASPVVSLALISGALRGPVSKAISVWPSSPQNAREPEQMNEPARPLLGFRVLAAGLESDGLGEGLGDCASIH